MRSLTQLTSHNIDNRLYEYNLADSVMRTLQRKRIAYETAILRQARKQLDERSLTYFCNICLKKYKKKVLKCNECGNSYFHQENTYTLDMLINPIHRVGIEFEGGWTESPHQTTSDRRKDKITFTLDQKSDGSVEVDLDSDDYHAGEMTTEPIPWNNDGKKKFKHIIKMAYPDITNNSCGGHFHLSLKHPSMISHLMSREFYDGWLGALNEFSNEHLPASSRRELNGRYDNSYCQDLFDPEAGAILGEGDRYAYLNFTSWATSRKTLEFRILPMFEDRESYWKTFNFLLSYTEDYLRDRFWLGSKVKESINTTNKEPILREVSKTRYLQKRVYSELVETNEVQKKRRR